MIYKALVLAMCLFLFSCTTVSVVAVVDADLDGLAEKLPLIVETVTKSVVCK